MIRGVVVHGELVMPDEADPMVICSPCRGKPLPPILPFYYDRMMKSLLDGAQKLPWILWFSLDGVQFFVFHRNECLRRLSSVGFTDFLFDLKDLVGGSPERGFVVHARRRGQELLVGCRVTGDQKDPEIVEHIIQAIGRNGEKIAAMKVDGTKEEVKGLVDYILLGVRPRRKKP